MSSESFEYNPQVITAAISALRGIKTDLSIQSDEIQNASHAIMNSWEGAAREAYVPTQRKWDAEFGDTTILLDNLITAAEEGLAAMLRTDNVIREGFGG